MTGTLILPVRNLSAAYLVPLGPGLSSLSEDAVRELLLKALPAYAPEPLDSVAASMHAKGMARAGIVPAGAVPPLPDSLQKYLGAEHPAVEAVASASRFVVVSAVWPPRWPPFHELVARASAAALAAELGQPLVDTATPRVLSASEALAAVQAPPAGLRLAQYVLVLRSAGANGLWMTTKGMSRFGLPELQVANVPPQYGNPWSALLRGIAAHLVAQWLAAVEAAAGSSSSGPAFAEIPDVLEIREADVARAYNAEPQATSGGSALVGLAFDPAPEPGHGFLTVRPPSDFPGSAGEYFAGASGQVFGTVEGEVLYTPPSQEMNEAIAVARAQLPSVRSRFLAGEIPMDAQLMVKHRLTAPGSGPEYPWAYVNSWGDPSRALASSAADAQTDPSVLTGRPIVIDAEAIVDWAIWIDGKGIVEGGLTNQVAMSHQP